MFRRKSSRFDETTFLLLELERKLGACNIVVWHKKDINSTGGPCQKSGVSSKIDTFQTARRQEILDLNFPFFFASPVDLSPSNRGRVLEKSWPQISRFRSRGAFPLYTVAKMMSK